MARTLMAQTEATKPSASGRWYGYEVYDVDGDFVLVIHTSTYDGIRRDSHYAAPEQAMDALTLDGALDEAVKKTAAYMRAVEGTTPYDPHGGEKHRYYEEN